MAIDREVNLKISALTDGGDKIRDLAKEVADLAAKGGDAAPAFQKLGKELDALANQQDLINNFSELNAKSLETKAAFEQTSTATRNAAATLKERNAALEAATAAERAATAAVLPYNQAIEASQVGIRQARADIAAYQVAIAASGTATKEQTAALALAKNNLLQYNASLAAARAALDGVVPAQQAQAAAAKAAAAAAKESATEFTRSAFTSGNARVEYERTAAALQTTAAKMDALGVSSRDLAAAQQRVKNGTTQAAQELDKLRANAEKTGTTFGNLGAIAGRAFAPVAALLATITGVSEFVRVNVELENIGRSLTALTGSSKGAAAEMSFIKEVSNRLGLELIETSKSYAQFYAATKGSSIEGEKSKFIFESVANAMSVAGKSAADTAGALNALGQMVSKGAVSMEELRGQLGDRLPGAMKLAADGLGLTTSQLEKLVGEGKILAVDLLPKLAEALNKTYKAGETAGSTLQQSWFRFKNAITETGEELGRSGILNGLLELGKAAAVVASTMGNVVSVIGTGLGLGIAGAVGSVKSLYNVLTTGDLETFRKSTLDAATVMRESFVEEIERAKTSVRKFADQSSITQSALDLLGLGATKAAGGVTTVSTAAAQSTKAAADAGLSWSTLESIYGELRTETEKAVLTSEKAVIARKAEGDASIQMAAAFGTEIEQRKASVEVAIANQTALQELAKQKVGDLSLLQSELVALREWVTTNKDQEKGRQETIKALEQVIAARQQETDKAVAQAGAARTVTEVARAEIATHEDNSKALDRLRGEYEQSIATLERVRSAKLAGKATTEEVTTAELAAGQAAIIYRDAIKDQQTAIEANGRAKQAQLSVQEATLRLAMAEVQTSIDVARIKGDETGAREATNKMRELEIKLAQLQAQALRAEAEATLEMVKIKREELRARGELTAAAEAELRATELGAQAKKIQGDIADETAKRLDKLRQATDSVTQSNNNVAGSYDRMGDSMGRAADAGERLSRVPPSEGEKKYDGKGYSSSYSAGDNLVAASEKAKTTGDYSGFGAADLALAKTQLEAAKANQLVYQNSNMKSIGDQDQSFAEVRKAQDLYDMLLRKFGSNSKGGGFADTGSTDAGGFSKKGSTDAGGFGSVHTVNINLGGNKTQVGMASRNDSDNLVSLLNQLNSDKARS